MNTANKITIARILLIPVFVGCAMDYGKSVQAGEPNEWSRVLAIVVFGVASVSDGVDGYIARHFNQKTRLGGILDPIADKGLLLAAIITLSLVDWKPNFPLWFPVLVIARDTLSIAGSLLVNHLAGKVEIRPHWSGKCATVFQMIAIGWLMLRGDSLTGIPLLVPTILAGVFVCVSGFIYLADGLRQLHATEHAHSEIPRQN
ncbi:MAG: CDP-diacylglycerol--glycerol-3-phosphate 3-phosphatidyltransferase [Verrucomicrobiales bacterium]|nr:CDP-diacylglycerol--glycerol-3-phosphate 3-phosphatidyltransferase [Verrucomicrobiales bacterium]